MFFVGDHSVTRPLAVEIPCLVGPRNSGQSSAGRAVVRREKKDVRRRDR
jgi:hypothetical protein